MTSRDTRGVTAPRSGLVVRVLGSLDVSVDGAPVDVRGQLRRRLILALVAAADRGATTDDLVAALWGDEAPQGAANAVQAHVSRLRRLLDPADERGTRWVVSRADGYQLRADWLDLNAFEAAVVTGESVSGADPAMAMSCYAQALSLPDQLAADDFPAWVALGHAHVRRRLGVEDAWADLAARYGSAPDADRILALACADPTREVRWILAMRALTRAGRQVEALATYEEARRVLADEYGLDPGRELRLTHASVLRQDPALTPPPTPTAGFGAPAYATSFLGRDAELTRLESYAARGRVVAVCGAGGVGKSRLVAEWARRSGRSGSSRWVDLRGTARGRFLDRWATELGLGALPADTPLRLDIMLRPDAGAPRIVILDNVDDLTDEARGVIETAVARVPELTVVYTSRVPVGVTGEHQLALRPLEASNHAYDLAASRLAPDADETQILEIAQRSGGLPLAIELLAANPTAAEAEPGVLGIRSLVTAALDGLPADTVRLFASFALLPMGAPPSLTEALATGLARTPSRRARLLSELVGASLIVGRTTRAGSGQIRHQTLQPVAQVAGLTEDADAERTYAAVGAWLSERTRPSYEEPPSPRTGELLPELVTIEAALEWYARHDPARLVALTLRAGDFWTRSGLGVRQAEWLSRGLESADLQPVVRAEALVGLSRGQGMARIAQGEASLDEAIRLLRDAGVHDGVVYGTAHAQRAVARGWRRDMIGFIADFRVARACARGSEWATLTLNKFEALSFAARLRPGKGVALALNSGRRLLALGDPDGAGEGLYFAALLAGYAHRTEVDAILDEAAEVARTASPVTQALIAAEVAKRAIATGSADAVEALLSAIQLTEQVGNLRTAAHNRSQLALILVRDGELVAARHQLRLAVATLLPLDLGSAALPVATLASLLGPRRAEHLGAVAWSFARYGGGSPPTRAQRNQIRTLAGPCPRTLPDLAAATTTVQKVLAELRDEDAPG